MKGYLPLAVVLILIITLVSILIVNQFKSTKQEEFTELYFNNHDELPKSISNESSEFSFSISSKNKSPTSYDYIIILKYDSKEKVLDRGQVILNPHETKTISTKFLSEENFEAGVISVKLLYTNQEIHFGVSNNDH